jgi:predicted nucleic acid-binding protein
MDDARLSAIHKLVDVGEASAIALALELPDAYLILDDRRARKVAVTFGLQITGTLGILLKAKLTGFYTNSNRFCRKYAPPIFV